MALQVVCNPAVTKGKIFLENPTLNHLFDAMRDTVAWLRSEKIPYLFTGPVAETLLWRPQLTRHIDVLAAIAPRRVESKVAGLKRFSLLPENNKDGVPCSIFLRHTTSLAGAAITASEAAFERQAAARALEVCLSGLDLRVATPEDHLVLQAREGKADGDDVEAILKSYPQADRVYMLQYLSKAPQGPHTASVAAALRRAPQTADFPPARPIVTM